MTSPYNDTIPNLTDPMSISCQQLRNNMGQIYNAYAKNHVNLSQNTNINGMHTQLEMVGQGSANPTTLADEVALYSKTGTGSQPQIFFRPSSDGTAIQISSNKVVSTSPYCQSFFAGPYVILFGKITGFSNNATLTFTTYYPSISFSEIEYVDVTPTGVQIALMSDVVFRSFNINTAGFDIQTNSTKPCDFYYFVIGKP